MTADQQPRTAAGQAHFQTFVDNQHHANVDAAYECSDDVDRCDICAQEADDILAIEAEAAAGQPQPPGITLNGIYPLPTSFLPDAQPNGALDWPAFANVIREVDGNHDLGAGELAERLLSHPKVRAALAAAQPVAHSHEHTKHTLKDVIEALPRYSCTAEGIVETDDGSWLKLADVRVLVAKAATLGAPVAPDADSEANE